MTSCYGHQELVEMVVSRFYGRDQASLVSSRRSWQSSHAQQQKKNENPQKRAFLPFPFLLEVN